MYPIVVAAKSQSSRVPRKNFREFYHGKSLVDLTLDLVYSCDLTDQVILSTDESNYSSVHPFTYHQRSASLATKDTPILDVLKNIIDCYNLYSRKYIILLQPTSPFRSPSHLTDFFKAIAYYDELQPSSPFSLFSVYQVEDAHPARMYHIENKMLVPLDPQLAELQCQFLPSVYHRNGAFYCFSIDSILAGKLYTDLQYPFLMNSESSVNIDTPLDFEFAQFLAGQFLPD